MYLIVALGVIIFILAIVARPYYSGSGVSSRSGVSFRERNGRVSSGHSLDTFPGMARYNRKSSPFGGDWNMLFRFLRTAPGGYSTSPARWARLQDIRHLVVKSPMPGRIVLGEIRGISSNKLLAAECGHSLMVVGPTQSGKTTRLAIPAVLEWQGPVLVASVKSDVAVNTLAERSRQGDVWIYDPTLSSGLSGSEWVGSICGWSPLVNCRDWQGARKMARMLTDTSKSAMTGMNDADFWHLTAMKLIAPLLFAAARTDRTMADVIRWLDRQEVGEVADILDSAGVQEACDAAEATWKREERQRSSIYTTAETILEVFYDPDVAQSERIGHYKGIPDPRTFISSRDTLYLCAPAHDQRRCRTLMAAVVTNIVRAAYEVALAGGHPLNPSLLVVIDEAANVAPLADLDELASTAAGHGVQLVTIWQDLAQLNARYAVRAASVINNHRAKLFCSGISDVATLEHAGQLVGEADVLSTSNTYDRHGYSGRTHSSTYRRLLPGDALRRMPPGQAVLVYGSLPPAMIQLREPEYGYRSRYGAVSGQGMIRSARRAISRRTSSL